MTRLQLILVGALSTFMTILVLVGSDGKSGLSQAAERALLAEQTTTVAAAGSGDVAGTTASSSGADATATTPAASAGDVASPTIDATAGEDATATTASTDDTTTDDSTDTDESAAATTPDAAPPATNIKHVFVITLQGRGFDATFGTGSPATYLNGELRPKGTLLTQFSSLGKADVADRLAFIGGQPPNASTKANCTTYKDIPPTAEVSDEGVVSTDGCIYPNTVLSLGDQLTSNRLTWQSYAEDHEKGPGGASATCRRPFAGDPDDTQVPRPGDAYAAKNNPFVYFHSLLDLSGCDADVGPLTKLDADLADPKMTPNLAYLAPSLCHDGSEAAGCDGPTGLAGADGFLQTWVPKILASKAYQEAGLLVITFAGGPAGDDAPSRNGTLLLSRYAQAGGNDDTKYDPYGLLRSVEDLFGLKALAKAKDAPSFSGTVLASAKVLTEGDG